MKRSIFVAGLLAFGVTAAIAQGNVVEQRQALMKEMGAQVRTLGGMLRGQAPFDLAQAQSGLRILAENSQKALPLFPESSRTVEKTGALPAIWENKAHFDSIFQKMNQDAQAALASVRDEASFKAAMPGVLQNCGACHNTFRQKT
ncbi:c-type cytochrome [Microvirga roseola]|uniref:c-type cytochrome n=1 Tax=Microvirga roseola TaxID=2883126 RepID=UPI001E512B9A|nr:cytochrome c [Microvirga roseola]